MGSRAIHGIVGSEPAQGCRTLVVKSSTQLWKWQTTNDHGGAVFKMGIEGILVVASSRELIKGINYASGRPLHFVETVAHIQRGRVQLEGIDRGYRFRLSATSLYWELWHTFMGSWPARWN